MNELQRQLRRKGVITYAIQEFRGADDFYMKRKLTPEINILRAVNFMRDFIQVARDDRTDVVLVDRGLFDTHCWLKWFALSNEVPDQYRNTVASLLDSVQLFASKYRIIWMDRTPSEANRSHGEYPGRIVNFANISSLRAIYEAELSNTAFPASFHRMDSDSGSAHVLATQIATQLKLT